MRISGRYCVLMKMLLSASRRASPQFPSVSPDIMPNARFRCRPMIRYAHVGTTRRSPYGNKSHISSHPLISTTARNLHTDSERITSFAESGTVLQERRPPKRTGLRQNCPRGSQRRRHPSAHMSTVSSYVNASVLVRSVCNFGQRCCQRVPFAQRIRSRNKKAPTNRPLAGARRNGSQAGYG